VTIKVSEMGAKGFDPISSEEKGNGLYNIKKRMDAIKGQISYAKSAEAMQIIFSAPIQMA
jgi:signal transduction histidine kinase